MDLQREYRIGTDDTYPYHFLDSNGEIRGMVGEVIQEAARRSGVRLQWRRSKIGPHRALSAGVVDIWPLLSVQTDIWPGLHFTEPYLSNTYVYVSVDPRFVSSSGRPDIRRVASVGLPLVLKLTRDVLPHAQSIPLKSREEAMAEVCSGRADVAIMEARPLQFFALERPPGCEGKKLFTEGLNVNARQLAIASLPQAAAAVDLLRAEIGRMSGDGTMDRIMLRWNYFYGGEADALYRNAQARTANRRSYVLAAGLAILSIFLFILLVRVRRAQNAAVAADTAKSMFIANMSHEIRTPMNGIIGMVQLALSVAQENETREYLRMARGSADSLLALLNDILDLSRIEAGKLLIDPVVFEPRTLVDEVMQLVDVSAHAKGLTIRAECAPDVPAQIVGDSLRLRQVIVNLLGNAVKFTETGHIEISVETNPAPRQLRIRIRDTGIGIPESKQKAIFQSFTQADGSIARKYGGTGLGLAISSHLVQLMGGSIGLKSEVGVGTEFELTVPYGLVPACVDAQATKTGVATTSSPKRILLAEDNLINQKVASRLLEKSGHTVIVASNGAEALEMLRQDEFDVILMDVQMPGMDGFEATGRIRATEAKSGRHVPIIAMTAHAMAGDKERCLDAGMDGYISKPVQLEALLQAINQATTSSLA